MVIEVFLGVLFRLEDDEVNLGAKERQQGGGGNEVDGKGPDGKGSTKS